MVEFIKHCLQVLTQRSRDGHDPVDDRIGKFNTVGMQEQTPQSGLFHETVEIRISVFHITGQRVTDIRGMDTNLVSPARFQLDIHQRCRSVG